MQLVRSAGKRTEAKSIGFGLTPDWFKTQYICFDWLKQVKISFFHQLTQIQAKHAITFNSRKPCYENILLVHLGVFSSSSPMQFRRNLET